MMVKQPVSNMAVGGQVVSNKSNNCLKKAAIYYLLCIRQVGNRAKSTK